MTVLATFFTLFEADASGLQQGLDESDKKGKQVEETVKRVDGAASGLGKSLAGVIAQAAGALTSVLTIGALVSGSLAAADTADRLGELGEALDANVEGLDAWGNAVKMNGGTVEGFQGTLSNLTAALAQVDVTGKSRIAPFFKELGIDLDAVENKGKKALDFLPQIADAFAGMDAAKSFGIGKKLGLDEGTIMLLQKGRREVEALIARQKELGTITQEDAEIAAKFNDTWDDVAHVFRNVFVSVNSTLLPIFTRVGEVLQTVGMFIQKHSDFVIGFMIAIGVAASAFLIPILLKMAAATLVAFAPFLLMGVAIAAAAAAFALLYDDIVNFMEGNDSLIGQIVERWPIVGEIAQAIGAAVMAMWDIVSWVFDTFSSLVQIHIALWQQAVQAVREFIQGSAPLQEFLGLLSAAFQAFGSVVGAVWDAISSRVREFIGLVGSAVNLVKGVAGAITGGLGTVKASLGIDVQQKDGAQKEQAAEAAGTRAAVGMGIRKGQAALAQASTTTIGAQTSNSISNSRSISKNTSVQTGPITVQTQATDAQGISKSVGNELGSQISQAAANYDDGRLA